jgi:hypothetical protein
MPSGPVTASLPVATHVVVVGRGEPGRQETGAAATVIVTASETVATSTTRMPSGTGPPPTTPGDFIRLRALEDLVIGLTACSAPDSNGGTFKPIHYRIERA